MTGSSQRLGAPGQATALSATGMRICPRCRTTYSSDTLSLCYRDGERLVDYERYLAIERDPMRGVLIGGKYRLLERVGQGGMGTIYRAQQAGLNRPVAVKILKRELNVDPDTVARFHREANAMSHLTHPNTVRVYDFGQTEDGLLYLVMELLLGELITDVMARGPLAVGSAVRITQQILRSLAEAHSKAIVHRDLKPDNVFVARVEGQQEPVIKVLDFGIAKVVAPDRRVDQFETQAGTVFGTPRYMSPEQAQGALLDGRSDLYSVGALLYQMLVGRPPFTDEDAVVIMAKHIQQVPDAPSAAVPERPIPKRLNDVVMRALQKDPAERFQEAAAFERALEACLPEVEAATEAHLTGHWTRRPARRWLTLSYVLLALVLSSAGYFGVRVYAKMNAPSTTQLVGAAPVVSEAEPVATAPPEPEPAAPRPLVPKVEPLTVASAAQLAASTTRRSDRAADGSPEAVEVSLRSEPSGASVFRAGKRIGETPLALRVRPDEPFVRIELWRAGFQPLAAELTAQDGTRLFSLKPVRTARPAAARARLARKPGQSSAAVQGASERRAAPAEPPKPSGPYERFD
ncbi:MAG: Serine/threonine protein kinase PrkC, regulator of stationary phase [Myxococcaceae bacterium]|nr:Serine/threonine protein kinase PrkC, regulator of stationary phase [Myxococcaceae bacterium]